ncbi:MAG: hypothetical protein HY744_17460 [Deltaproteobacteria bacterium]|nr:hypothetical protein [Deltaproteobacteria bacterium]
MPQRKRVLITVKTYPLPSKSYQELVCTAGVLEDGSFIRLYPVDFRYRPYWQWYKKYQWVDVDVEKNADDDRKESYRPVLTSIKPLGEPLDKKKKWAARRQYVLAQGAKSMETLWDLQQQDNVSLGIVRPKVIEDFVVEPDDLEWKPEWKVLFQQMSLFGPAQKPLEKIPSKFSYRFRCDDARCNGHKMMIEDWEVGQLYLQMRDKYGDPKVAVEKVRQKFFDQMCAPDVDTHFYVGTVLKYGSWIVLGVFWPKK